MANSSPGGRKRSPAGAGGRADTTKAAGGEDRGPGFADPVIAELRRAGLLPVLVLNLIGDGVSYGNQLIHRISEMTGGLLTVNPNTMYPLLRSLEKRGLISGEWEHPERRSRRLYVVTEEGRAELAELAHALAPRLESLARGVRQIRAFIGREGGPDGGADGGKGGLDGGAGGAGGAG